MLELDEAAPAFMLPDQDGKNVTLEEYRGKWVVLYFYPKDDTPGCTTQACEFTAGIKDFKDIDAVVLGCSPDSPASHRNFIKKFNLKVRLLSDPGHEVMAEYGAWGKKNMYGIKTVGVIRSTVIIDPEGFVAHHWKKVQSKGHAQKVRQKLAELRGA